LIGSFHTRTIHGRSVSGAVSVPASITSAGRTSVLDRRCIGTRTFCR